MQSQIAPSKHTPACAPRLSVVVPCYNEYESLSELHARVVGVCEGQVGPEYELVLINDGSTDGTWMLIQELCGRDSHVVGVNLSRNHGHQLALSAGLTIARGDRVLILDADLQDPPELLGEMMALMDAGSHVVYGQRTNREEETWFKIQSASLFYRLLRKLVDIEIPVDTGDFRLMSRRAVDLLNSMPEQNRFIRGMVSWIGLQQSAVRYERQARFAGETKYPFSKMLRFAVDAVTGFSITPLRIASYLGIVLGVMGVGLLVYTGYSLVIGETVQGWASLMTVVVILGSFQLLILGVLGEYLGRLFMEAKRRPIFIIDQIVAASREAELGDLTDAQADARRVP